MGQEITDSHFEDGDFAEFDARLRRETSLLAGWFAASRFAAGPPVGGFELEAWLVDSAARPANVNESFLGRLSSPLVVPELATFNVEINSSPVVLQGRPFFAMAEELKKTLGSCQRIAADYGASLATIGILPTAKVEDFTLSNMSSMQRYRALNEQVFRLRQGRPLRFEIKGRDQLQIQHSDVMLEAAATSFQIHLKVDANQGAGFYNASKILSAPMVALGANSPFLFGKDLWAETRIPLFEQAVAVGPTDLSKRVTLGIRYVDRSVMECFEANLTRFPVLLPHLLDEPAEHLAHLRLHNGTIWRWNRPLIGFDADGTPHLRIEHRVVSAGPSVADMIANAAMYYGCVCSLAQQPDPVAKRMPFERMHSNFYTAARDGLDAEIFWLNGRMMEVRRVIVDILLPLGREGLLALGVDSDEAEHWLEIIRARVESGQNGAAWQRAFVERYGADMEDLTLAYLANQAGGTPVHTWPVG